MALIPCLDAPGRCQAPINRVERYSREGGIFISPATLQSFKRTASSNATGAFALAVVSAEVVMPGANVTNL
eukprot:1148515-Pelagomonas_calceolata.AAC.7